MPRNKHGIEVEEIAEMEPDSKEAGIPIFKAETNAGSYLTFAFLRSTEGMAVYHVESRRYGDFKRLMDAALAQFCGNTETKITFFNVVTELMGGKDLDDVLIGFEREERVAEEGPYEGEKYDILVGHWDPQGRHLQ